MPVKKGRRKSKPATRNRSQAAIGVFNFGDASKAAADNLQHWIDQKLLDPKNPEQWAAANYHAQKSIEQLSESAGIAGAKFEQLKRYQLDAANGRTTFDTFATGSLTTLTNGFSDIEMRG
jgi:hypothetical protein